MIHTENEEFIYISSVVIVLVCCVSVYLLSVIQLRLARWLETLLTTSDAMELYLDGSVG